MNSTSLPALPALLASCVASCVVNRPADDSDTAVDDGTSSTGDGDGDGDATDTGSEELCGINPADEPYVTLSQAAMDIVDGSPVALECGGQGSFMIRFNVEMGGFVPPDLDVPMHVVLDVEGYNLGPAGHFADSDYTVFAGCCSDDYYAPDYCYGDPLLVTLFPPDAIPDLEVLHELPAVLTITMTAAGEEVERIIDVQMWALADESWEFCNYGYYGTSG